MIETLRFLRTVWVHEALGDTFRFDDEGWRDRLDTAIEVDNGVRSTIKSVLQKWTAERHFGLEKYFEYLRHALTGGTDDQVGLAASRNVWRIRQRRAGRRRWYWVRIWRSSSIRCRSVVTTKPSSRCYPRHKPRAARRGNWQQPQGGVSLFGWSDANDERRAKIRCQSAWFKRSYLA